MQNIIKSWFKYMVFVGLFGVGINLIYLVIPIYIMVVYDKVLFSFSKATLFTLSVGVLFSLIMMGLLDYYRRRILGQAGNDLAQKMVPFLYESMQADAAGIAPKGYDRGVFDLEQLRDGIVRGQIFYIFDLPWVLIYLGVLYFVHPLVGTVAIAGVFLVSLFQILLRKLGKNQYIAADIAFQANANFVNTCLHHAQLISGMGMVSAVIKKYKNRYQQVLVKRSRADGFQSGAGAVIRLLQVICMAAVFTTAVFVFFTNGITTGTIFACVILIVRLFYPFEQSLAAMKSSIEVMAAYARLKHFVDTQAPKERLSLPVPEGRVEAQALTMAIQGRAILHNISFALEPGETLGILGPSSAGKTSLCKLLLGIWPTTSGKITLDKAEIGQWPRNELGKYVGYLPQETELFPGTVAENISRLADVDSELVVKAARKAGVHEMILKLPQGYDTKIDRTGKSLAAGQRQLISLARALYGDTKYVVLDEPQTHLDDLGFAMMVHALNNLKQEKITTILVTDRPNLLMSMDKLLVIREGQVAMYGPGKEVINQLANKQQPQQAAGV